MAFPMANGETSEDSVFQTPKQQVESWQTKVARKQKSCRDKIPPAWLLPTSVMSELRSPLETYPNRLLEMDIPRRSGIMSDNELSITEDYTVPSLLEALASSKITALEVTVAFSKRAAIAGQLVSRQKWSFGP